MRAVWALLLTLISAAGVARASEGVAIDSPSRLREVCRTEAIPGPRQLYIVQVPARAYRFLAYQAEGGFLPVDTRRNLRLFRGGVELFAAGLEPIAFSTSAEDAARLREAHAGGAGLRVGFFLGYDDPSKRACLLRPSAGVTIVRMDLAYAELVASDGQVLVRQETGRFVDWRDDPERPRTTSEGPHAVVGPALVPSGFDGWRREIVELGKGALGVELTRCHAAAVEKGGTPRGRVSLRASIAAATGTAKAVTVELSTVEPRSSACLAEALRAQLKLSSVSADRAVEIRVPILLAD